MMKKINIALVAMLLVFQTILMPLGTYGVTFAEESDTGSTSETSDLIKQVAMKKYAGSGSPSGDIDNEAVWTSIDRNENPNVEVKPGDALRVDLQFEVIAGTHKKGTDYKFQLPANVFKFDEDTSIGSGMALEGDLLGGKATYTVSTGGLVTITLTEDFVSNATGTFKVGSYFNEAFFDHGTEYELSFPISTGEQKIPIKFDNGTAVGLDKTVSKVTPAYNPKTATWQIDFNLAEEELKGAKVDDEVKASHPQDTTPAADFKVTTANIKVYELTVGIDGTPKQGDEAKDFDTSTFPINFGNTNKAYRIVYDTSISENIETTLTNEAVLTYKNAKGVEQRFSDSDETTFRYGGDIAKEGKYTFDDVNNEHIVNWEIKYNFGERSVNGQLTDSFTTSPASQTVKVDKDSFEFFKVTFDKDGNITAKDKVTSAPTPTVTGNGFTVNLGNTSDAYIITYKTVDKTVSKDYSIENTVRYTNDASIKAVAPVTVAKTYISKSSTKINYKDRIIDWEILLNRDNFKMTNPTIVDKMESGLTYKDGSLKIEEGTVSAGGSYTWTNVTSQFTPVVVDNENSFTLEPKSKPMTTSSTYRFTYQTDFDKDSRHHANGVGPGPGVFTDFEYSTDIQMTAPDFIDIETNRGDKTGFYNAKTKTARWTIDVNYAQQNIANPIIKDTYTTGLGIKPTNMKVVKLAFDADNTTLVETAETITPKITEKSDGEFEIQLPGPIEYPVRITYDTVFNGLIDTTKIDNRADFYDGTTLVTDKLIESITIPYGGQFVTKDGKQFGKSKYVDWSVEVNQSNSTVKNAQITDTLTAPQEFVDGSFVIYAGVVEKDGTISYPTKVETNEAGQAITPVINGNSLTISLGNITKPYKIVYRTFAGPVTDGTSLGNKVQFNGDGVTKGNTNENSAVTYRAAFASGAIADKIGTIELEKVAVNKDGTDLFDSAALQGAKFKVYAQTDANTYDYFVGDMVLTGGFYKISGISPQSYKIVEESAPEGYKVLQKEYIVDFGQFVPNGDKTAYTASLTGNDKVKNQRIEQRITVTTTKEDDPTIHNKVEDEAPIEGATYELLVCGENGATTSKLTGIKTDSSGQFIINGYYDNTGKWIVEVTGSTGTETITDLPAGTSVTVKQTGTVTNYNVSTEAIDCQTFIENPTNDTTETVTVENKPDTGAVNLSKKSNDIGQEMAATFGLYSYNKDTSAVGNLIKEFTNGTGEKDLDNIKVGTYAVKEISSGNDNYYTDKETVYVVNITKNSTFAVNSGQVIINDRKLKSSTITLQGTITNYPKCEGTSTSGIPGATFTLKSNNQATYYVEKSGARYVVLNDGMADYILVPDGENGSEKESINPADKKLYTFTTDANGQYTIGNLPSGITFTVEQTSVGSTQNPADPCYIIPDNPVTTVTPGNNPNITNKTQAKAVVLTKKANDTGSLQNGVHFELFVDETSKGQFITGYSYTYNSNGTWTSSSGEQGKIIIDELPEADYVFKEIKPLEQYIASKDTPFKISKTVSDQVVKAEAVNYRKTGSVDVTYTPQDDENFIQGEGCSLEGTTFELQNANGAAVKSTTHTDGKQYVVFGNSGSYYILVKENGVPVKKTVVNNDVVNKYEITVAASHVTDQTAKVTFTNVPTDVAYKVVAKPSPCFGTPTSTDNEDVKVPNNQEDTDTVTFGTNRETENIEVAVTPETTDADYSYIEGTSCPALADVESIKYGLYFADGTSPVYYYDDASNVRHYSKNASFDVGGTSVTGTHLTVNAVKTDGAYKATFTGVPKGSYVVKQMDYLECYPSTPSIPVNNIDGNPNNDDAITTIYNNVYDIALKKQANDATLTDVEFKLFLGETEIGTKFVIGHNYKVTLKDGIYTVAEAGTNEAGEIRIEELAAGTYTFKEQATNANTNYVLVNENVTVGANAVPPVTVKQTVTNNRGKGTITATPEEKNPNANLSGAACTLEGTEFGLFDEAGKAVKTINGQVILGTAGAYYFIDGNDVKQPVTDEHYAGAANYELTVQAGETSVQFTNVPYGNYQVQELSTTNCFTIVDDEPKPVTVDKETPNPSEKFDNERNDGNVTTKVTEVVFTGQACTLADLNFGLFYANGEPVQTYDEKIVHTKDSTKYVVNADGTTIDVTNETLVNVTQAPTVTTTSSNGDKVVTYNVEFTELPYGEYDVKPIKTGDKEVCNPVNVDVTVDEPTEEVEITTVPPTTGEITVELTEKDPDTNITNIGCTIDGATFGLYVQNGENQTPVKVVTVDSKQYVLLGSENSYYIIKDNAKQIISNEAASGATDYTVTIANGTAQFGNLPHGDYVVKQETTTDCFNLPETPTTSVKVDGSETTPVENDRKEGEIVVDTIEIDGPGCAQDGSITYGLTSADKVLSFTTTTDTDGNIIATYVADGTEGTVTAVTVAEDKLVKFVGLPYGEYKVTTTETDCYEVPTTPIQVDKPTTTVEVPEKEQPTGNLNVTVTEAVAHGCSQAEALTATLYDVDGNKVQIIEVENTVYVIQGGKVIVGSKTYSVVNGEVSIAGTNHAVKDYVKDITNNAATFTNLPKGEYEVKISEADCFAVPPTVEVDPSTTPPTVNFEELTSVEVSFEFNACTLQDQTATNIDIYAVTVADGEVTAVGGKVRDNIAVTSTLSAKDLAVGSYIVLKASQEPTVGETAGVFSITHKETASFTVVIDGVCEDINFTFTFATCDYEANTATTVKIYKDNNGSYEEVENLAFTPGEEAKLNDLALGKYVAVASENTADLATYGVEFEVKADGTYVEGTKVNSIEVPGTCTQVEMDLKFKSCPQGTTFETADVNIYKVTAGGYEATPVITLKADALKVAIKDLGEGIYFAVAANLDPANEADRSAQFIVTKTGVTDGEGNAITKAIEVPGLCQEMPITFEFNSCDLQAQTATHISIYKVTVDGDGKVATFEETPVKENIAITSTVNMKDLPVGSYIAVEKSKTPAVGDNKGVFTITGQETKGFNVTIDGICAGIGLDFTFKSCGDYTAQTATAIEIYKVTSEGKYELVEGVPANDVTSINIKDLGVGTYVAVAKGKDVDVAENRSVAFEVKADGTYVEGTKVNSIEVPGTCTPVEMDLVFKSCLQGTTFESADVNI